MTIALIASIEVKPKDVHTSKTTHALVNQIARHKLQAHAEHGGKDA